MDNASRANGTGVAEFDELVEQNKDELNRLKQEARQATGAHRTEAREQLDARFDHFIDQARRQIAERDGNADNELNADERADTEQLDKINDAADSASKDLDANSDVLIGGDNLPKLSEIRWIERVDDDTRKVTLHDGTTIIVDDNLNQKAFYDLTTDFENQLRKVSADAGFLLDQGYGLIGDNELQTVIDAWKNLKPGTLPVVERHNDHTISFRYTDKDGKEHKYFAYDDHSPKAYERFKQYEAIMPLLKFLFTLNLFNQKKE